MANATNESWVTEPVSTKTKNCKPNPLMLVPVTETS